MKYPMREKTKSIKSDPAQEMTKSPWKPFHGDFMKTRARSDFIDFISSYHNNLISSMIFF